MRLAPLVPLLLVTALLAPPGPARAGEADVVDVEVRCRPAPGGRAASVCRFSVTVEHADAGWDHYANGYEIVGTDGVVIATRVLRHPHVDEQPFRRSLPNVRLPHATKQVVVRARDLVHGLGGKQVTVTIPHALVPAEPPAPPPPSAPPASGSAP